MEVIGATSADIKQFTPSQAYDNKNSAKTEIGYKKLVEINKKITNVSYSIRRAEAGLQTTQKIWRTHDTSEERSLIKAINESKRELVKLQRQQKALKQFEKTPEQLKQEKALSYVSD